MKTALLGFAFLMLHVLAPAADLGGGDEVVVVYNSNWGDSKRVAQYYAERRQVPKAQILGLSLPETEEMSREAFREQLQMPLARFLEKNQLWQFAPRTLPATNGHPERTDWQVSAAKVRYVVLCYGVPSRIAADPTLVEEGAENTPSQFRRNEAAVDNELAWLPHVKGKVRLTGPLVNAVYGVTNATLLHPTNGILMVARLDGPSADIARGLVDKALEAETNGLWGRAYFDLRGITNGAYALGDQWIRAAAEIARYSGFETGVDENEATFPPWFPMSQIALYAGWYSGNACGPFALNKVEFMPGAFAYHLHSSSAGTLRSAHQNWVGPFLAKGVTATMGCVYEPYLTGTPDIGVFFGRFLAYGFTFGESAYAATPVLSWQTTVIGDPLYRPFRREPRVEFENLQKGNSKLLEWAHLKVANLNLARKFPLGEVVAYLEQVDLTRQSAVLMEKLSDLYEAQGKPSSSVFAGQQALKLDPSLQQRVRLTLNLAAKLTALDRGAEAADVYRDFLRDFPDYQDRIGVLRTALALARKLNRPEASSYEEEITKRTPPPPPAPANGTNQGKK